MRDMLKIYNTLTQQKEIFKPNDAKKVKLYVCGPTVYDYAHIGNARTYAAFDVIIRFLQWSQYEVLYVRNITDIDDKIIKRANENKEDFKALVSRFTTAIHEDFAALGLLVPDYEPRATEFIPAIIKFIENLLAVKAAYIAQNGEVYFDVRRFASYGALSHHNIDDLESGARIEVNTLKKDPLDFVLWKLAKPQEPAWSSPWGLGRPGWHIECSAMSMALLGDNFDIHGGGRDLIFPHHENEIAQSEGLTQKKFVNVWMHTGYLQFEKEKMSKSLGNFFTIRELLQQYDAECLRYFLISSHYRSSLSYSENSLSQAKSALGRLYNALKDLPKALPVQESTYEKAWKSAMEDDFNTPIAFSVLFDLAHEVQRLRLQDIHAAAEHGALLKSLGAVLGILQDDPLNYFKKGKGLVDAAKIEELITLRNQARKDKNWQEADRIRDLLLEMSVILEDSDKGTTWKFTE